VTNKTRVARLEAVGARIANLRLLIAALFAATGWLSVWLHLFSAWWLLLPIAAFAGAAVHHGDVRRSRRAAQRAAGFYRRGLARIEDRWMGSGRHGEHFDLPHHVYASDLDLFGKDSLFELLSTARTRMGEQSLAQWLLAPAPLDQILIRHGCVIDLRSRLDLREDLSVLGNEADVGVHPEALAEWAETPNRLTGRWIPVAAMLLPLLAAATAALWAVSDIVSPFVAIVVIEVGILYALRKRVGRILNETENAFDNLKLLAALLTRIEREAFDGAQMQSLIGELLSHDLQPSQAIANLSRIVDYTEARRNPIVAMLSVPLMYAVHCALAAERWRTRHGTAVRTWLRVIGQIEALGHPLIATATCVRNDVAIEGRRRVLLVSGSNMSGKSTLLRSVGINTVLAMAGAPVRARRMTMTPMQVGASIRINDSLHEGSSRFHAEITRLRQLHDLQDCALPLLFLLDELLQGTNSTDRRIGAEGVLRAFVERGAIGLVSTHDLALTDIAGSETGVLHNVHFQDEIVAGRMQFDFKLREGIVRLD
jgi:MutS domain V